MCHRTGDDLQFCLRKSGKGDIKNFAEMFSLSLVGLRRMLHERFVFLFLTVRQGFCVLSALYFKI